MTDYTRGTGNAGTLLIRDTGSYVEYWILCSDPYTWTGGLSWSATGTGGGSVALNAGFGSRQVGSALISSSQNVTFSIGASGTSGLGGPTSFTQYITRGGGGGGGGSVPSAPAIPVASEVTQNSMRISWNLPSNGGSALDQMLLRYGDHTNPLLSSGTGTGRIDIIMSGSTTTRVVTGLLANEIYYWKVYAHNANGYSSGSPILQQATLPPNPPTMSLLASIDGTQMVVTLAPPGGASGLTSYRVETRPTIAQTPTTVHNNATSPITITGRTPGVSYEYRASAFFGTAQTPWTSWAAAIQPNPNTNPGDYFDGGTTDTPAQDYAWTGTANNSTSTATSLLPTGWRTFADADDTSGGTGAIHRASGGYNGSWSARAVFFTDCTAAGFAPGQSDGATGRSVVAGNAIYYGSVYVQPSRVQRMIARVDWYTSAGAFISSSSGTDVVVPVGEWTRLVASGSAPSNAAFAAVRAVDVTGTSWATWKGGDWLLMDAAMVTLEDLYDYFDGYTPSVFPYEYAWEGTANASASTRTTLVTGGVDPLLDPDCPPPPTPPAPPTIVDECIVEIGTWRRYWALIPADEVSEWLAMIPTIYLTTGGVEARQVRVRIYPNPLNLDQNGIDDSTWVSEQVISYMPPLTLISMEGPEERVWAEVNGGAPIAADKLLYGTNGGPATWPILSCGQGYLLSFDVPLDSPAGNVVIGLALTRRM